MRGMYAYATYLSTEPEHDRTPFSPRFFLFSLSFHVYLLCVRVDAQIARFRSVHCNDYDVHTDHSASGEVDK